MTSPVFDQGVYASPETWARIRKDPAFVELVRLARVTNSLSLVYPPVFVTLADQSPRARRERFAAIAYAGALLHEGLHTAQSLGQFYRNMPAYQQGFADIFADPVVRSFRAAILDRVRDKLVFHFDRSCLAEGLDSFSEGETLIATATDFQQGEIYFDLADDALLGYLYGKASTVEAYLAHVSDFIEKVTGLFNRYMRAAHRLIPAALHDMGCTIKPAQRPDPIPDDAG